MHISFCASNVGSVVECSPATRAARVRFPDVAAIAFTTQTEYLKAYHYQNVSMSGGLAFFHWLELSYCIQTWHGYSSYSKVQWHQFLEWKKLLYYHDHWNDYSQGKCSKQSLLLFKFKNITTCMSTSSILFFTFFDDFCNETIFSNILMCYDNDFLQISINHYPSKHGLQLIDHYSEKKSFLQSLLN